MRVHLELLGWIGEPIHPWRWNVLSWSRALPQPAASSPAEREVLLFQESPPGLLQAQSRVLAPA
jgi:hypothetical protein